MKDEGFRMKLASLALVGHLAALVFGLAGLLIAGAWPGSAQGRRGDGP